ncbi:MAG: hypothetical protein IJP92_08255, partial [Lachnospiraceae bacterium]|nr:hypothetical protein [Lachnospiraceae bacterium]
MRTPFDDDDIFDDDDMFDDDPDFFGGDPDFLDDDIRDEPDVPDPVEEEIIRRMVREFGGKDVFGDTENESAPSERLSDLIRRHPKERQQDWIDDLGIRPQAERLKEKQIPELIANEFLMSSVMRRILLERGVAYYDAFKTACGETGHFYPDVKTLVPLRGGSDLPYVVAYVDETFSVLPDVRDAFLRMDKEELREDVRLCGIIQELLPVLLDIYVILPLPVFYESVRTYAGTQRRDELLKPLLLQALKRWEEAFRLDGNRIVPVVAGKSGVVQT